MGLEPSLLEALSRDPASASLPQRARAIVDYVLKLTLTPWEMTEQDVGLLRDAGLDDSEILDVCQVASYYAFVNRIAQGLGVELEDGDGVETTTTSPPGPAGRG